MTAQSLRAHGDHEVPAYAPPPPAAHRPRLCNFAPEPVFLLAEILPEIEFRAAALGRPPAHDRYAVSAPQGAPGYGDDSSVSARDEGMVSGGRDLPARSGEKAQQGAVRQVTAHGPNRLPDGLRLGRETQHGQGFARGQVTPFRGSLAADREVAHQVVNNLADRDDANQTPLLHNHLLVIGQAHLRPRFTDRLCRDDPRGFVRIDYVNLVLRAHPSRTSWSLFFVSLIPSI